MINKDTYKRLTNSNIFTYPNCIPSSIVGEEDCFVEDTANLRYHIDEKIYDRLAELEDKITDGTIIEIDKNLIGQGIIGIHHFTDGTYQLDLDENIVIGFTIDGVITFNGTHDYNDEFRNGMFFIDNEKGRAEAEARLKELQENK